ncbi:hypothetical protein [Wenzhouxiangella limi]|uniref:Uncharacterized protein n=1 Tax=Wenzhouxiangella limi TaxID=2707351 RepID=A0A845V9G8_9GAMM|nr:hypothetical protein [Wenzhouxiangella limi]NDY96791.1 hypothetical protein [Wenzhouxiangella limi]
MEHQVQNLLRVWADAGVTVERHDLEFTIIGMDPPDWWPDWCARHQLLLAAILPDLDPPRPKRQPLPEDRPCAYNLLSMGMRW